MDRCSENRTISYIDQFLAEKIALILLEYPARREDEGVSDERQVVLTASPNTSPTLSAIRIGELTICFGLARESRNFS